MAGEQSSRSRTTRNKGAATKAAEKNERARRHAETSKDLSWVGDGSQERPSRGGEHAEPAELESLSLDGMPNQLNKQTEFIQGLMELLKESLDDMPAELNQQGELTAGLVIELSRHVVEALLQQLHQALDELLLLIEVLIELIGHAIEG